MGRRRGSSLTLETIAATGGRRCDHGAGSLTPMHECADGADAPMRADAAARTPARVRSVAAREPRAFPRGPACTRCSPGGLAAALDSAPHIRVHAHFNIHVLAQRSPKHDTARREEARPRALRTQREARRPRAHRPDAQARGRARTGGGRPSEERSSHASPGPQPPTFAGALAESAAWASRVAHDRADT